MPANDRGKYGRKHHERSRQLRRQWYAAPSTTCALCGLTHAEGVAAYGEKRAAWDADHPHGRSDLPLRPAHATCNRSEGAARGNRDRAEPRTESW